MASAAAPMASNSEPQPTPPSEPTGPSADDFPEGAIAITGVGCRLPGANSLDDLWDIISQGQSRLEKLRPERCDPKHTYRAMQDPDWIAQRNFYGNFLDDASAFDHAFFGISPREATYMDPQQRLLLETAFEAMDSSGYLRNHSRARGDPVGCFIGASYTEYLENTSAYTPSAFTATSTIRAFLSGKISYHFGWTGPSEVIDTACSASLVAVHRAVRALQAGECTVALAGGVNIVTGVHNYFDLARANFLSPTGQCKPFDNAADGYCRADGVCLVVLKPLRQAVADGDHIMGVLPAVATNQGGVHAPGITVPDGTAQKALYRKLVDQSGWAPETVSYMEAHGTGTRVGDPIEMSSIREVFGGPQRSHPVYVGSLKANIGHSETAAGAAGLLKVLAMFRNGGIPPLCGFRQLNSSIPPLEPDKIVIPTETTDWRPPCRRVACVSSYGASGSNSAVLCAEWRGDDERHQVSTPAGPSVPSGRYPILLSAASAESVARQAQALSDYLKQPRNDITLGDVAYTLSERRKHHRYRWTTVVEDAESLAEQLRTLDIRSIAPHPKTPRKIVLAFSGQSDSKIGLDPAIIRANPRFSQHLEACNRVLLGLGGPDILSGALYQTEPITDPSVLQCGLVAVQYACARCWIEGGLEVAAVVGHSLGELAALAVSGVLSLEDALKVVYRRAELIKRRWGPEGGAMVAIHAPLETVEAVIGAVVKDGGVLEVACHNSLNSHVAVGSRADVEAAIRVLEGDACYQGIRFHRVGVTHGFHSRFTEPLLEELAGVEKEVTFQAPSIPLETCTQDPVVFNGQQDVQGYLTNHARNAVYFSDAVRRLEDQLGLCAWVEAGINTPIAPMVRRAVATPALHVFQAVATPEAAAADLWREGLAATSWQFLTPVDKGLRHVWLPPYSFDRPQHWLAHADRAVEEHHKAAQRRPQLVTYDGKGDGGATPDSHLFSLHTDTERYDCIVRGHSVRGLPLCPASVYMEAAVMALGQLGHPARGKTVTFRETVFSRPLGCDPQLEVQLSLTPAANLSASAWHFVVHSAGRSTHSEGEVDITSASDKGSHCTLEPQRLVSKVARLRCDEHTESIKKATAYRLFSRVVEYGDLMQGIQHMTMGAREAVARVQAPKTIFPAAESTVTDFYDAITLDTFIQVLGLLVNHNTACEAAAVAGRDDIYVASSIGTMELRPVEFGSASRVWTVYASYSVLDAKTTSGEVYVLTESGEVVFSAAEVRFVKVQAASMERLLEMANPTMAAAKPTPSAPQAQGHPGSLAMRDGEMTGPDATQRSHAPPLQGGRKASLDAKDLTSQLVALISSYTGVPVDDMEATETLGSMGLDSLASIELADEMAAKLGLQVEGMGDLNDCTLQSLLDQLPASPGSGASTPSPPASDTTSLTTPSPGSELDALDLQERTTAPRWERPKEALDSRFTVEQHVYKQVGGIDILADVYVPTNPPKRPMCVALMIHGGGFLTLSRKAVRTRQTKHLLAQGLLPVSLDYRLCPQVNAVDGAMADVADACRWAQEVLPDLAADRGIALDRSRYVVVGWSTGGTLAMTTAWSAQDAGVPAPAAILAFYCPVSYDPSNPINMGDEYSFRTMPLGEIRRLLPAEPTTEHTFKTEKDGPRLGWLQPDDPRSELVLTLIKEERGMALLLNDGALEGTSGDAEALPFPDAARAAALSPLAQLRRGRYRTPTCVVFGDADEIAPYAPAAEFARVMQDQGLRGSLVTVAGARHIFDLDLAPGSDGWARHIEPAYAFLVGELEACGGGSA